MIARPPVRTHKRLPLRSKNLQDYMALGRLGFFLLLVSVGFPLGLSLAILHIPLPLDAQIHSLPLIVTKTASSGGILVARHAKRVDVLDEDDEILSLYVSNLPHPNVAAAAAMAETQAQISRFETQRRGELSWGLSDFLRARAFENDAFTKFVVDQQKEFKDYYDSLDQYGREIYRQKQRLADRIADMRTAAASYEQEKLRINARLVQVLESEKITLRREIAYLDDDIAQTEELRRKFENELRALEPRFERLIRRKAVEVTPTLEKLYHKRARLYQKLALGAQPEPVTLRVARAGRIGELLLGDVGDVFGMGDVLYRLLPSGRKNQEVTIRAHLSPEAAETLRQGAKIMIVFKDIDGKSQKFSVTFLRKFLNPDAAHGATRFTAIFQMPVAGLYQKLQRVPVLQERGALFVSHAPDVRMRGFWQRAQMQRRAWGSWDGVDFKNFPFLNRQNWHRLKTLRLKEFYEIFASLNFDKLVSQSAAHAHGRVPSMPTNR